MGKISTYTTDSNVTFADKVIGTDAENSNETKNYLLSDVYDLFASQSSSIFEGSPIFQPNIVTYSETTAAGILVNMVNNNTFWSAQISAPNLTQVYGSIYLRGNSETDPPLLNTISLPLLQSINLNEAPYLNYCLRISDFPLLTTINVSSLVTCYGNIKISNNPLLTTLNASNLTTFSGNFDGTYNAFNQATVNGILNQLANIVVSTGVVIDLRFGTNSAPSISAAGYIATLESNGCTVYTN